MKSIDKKAKLTELPRISIELDLLKVCNECLRTQLDAKLNEQQYEEGIITAANNIIGRYLGKLDMITSDNHIVEID